MPSLHFLTTLTLTLSLSLLLQSPLLSAHPSPSSDFIDPRIINRDLRTYGSTSGSASQTRPRSLRKMNRRNRAPKSGPKRLNRATEATLKCLTAYSLHFAMGIGVRIWGRLRLDLRSAGTKCVDNAITWDDATATATSSAAKATTTSEPTPTIAPVHLAVKKTTTAAKATPTPGSSSDDEDDDDCDSDDDSDDDQETTTTAASKPTTAAAASKTGVSGVNLNAITGTYTTGGKGTFFYQYGAHGACGKIHADSDPIVALALARYGTGSNDAPDCGRKVQVVNVANGKSVVATVADACPGCANYNSLDLSTGAFDQIAEQATGVIDIKWKYLD
ncbi:BZ3500_MvSof-1268-A1-R1_Chr5-2g07831 [Microbotryum saponariae]|uniref:BZ3500_MvSof-1268-A1-R1_Chr5-2g07831 protein n=1 Tax=Microbotryum saponariae TaxID=289078 RepID=A0A2X0KGN2_9BASI|nr:BZ3500_MvSof-1268-A1-R1_Chr5-2g07831 [Microbotryum saponariae]SDA05700.1 BZ3501_MvSof-1269-A2-R1_Chr5-2g07653 [Microbotryum saponariae]